MPTLDDVRSLVLKFPQTETTTSWGREAWAVDGRKFSAHRPLSGADVKRMKPAVPPTGDLISVVAEELGEKEAILAEGKPGFLDIAHFAGHPIYLIQLDVVDPEDLKRALEDAWLAQAPTDLAEQFIVDRRHQRP